MLVTGIVLALSLVGAYIFLGMKLSESIIHGDIKIFFWSLYFVTLMTIINISMSIYFYSSLKDKKGPLGSRGNKGRMGERGEPGSCEESDCKSKSVQIMIEEALQNHYNESDITPHERKIICNLINNEEAVVTTSTSGRSVTVNGNKHIINGTNGAGDGWTLKEYNTFKKNLESALNNTEPDNKFPKHKHFKQRLTDQEQPESELETHLKNLIVDSCKTDGTPWEAEKILNKNTTKECV